MIDLLATLLLIISVLMLLSLGIVWINNKHKKNVWFNKVFALDDSELISESESKKQNAFKLKLLQAGITRKEFNEIIFASIIAGLALSSLVFFLDLSLMAEVILVLISVSIALFTPYLYIQEQIKARIKRIDDDLPVFIDLLIIILEGGGGLNNAIDEVTTQARDVIGKDMLGESSRFKHELITYGSEIAYTNLVKRTGSEAIGTIVGYMRLSEETGIGVKTIFENQAQEIRDAQSLNVQKRAATMNISIVFTMFIFILPAIIAMIAMPISAGALIEIF